MRNQIAFFKISRSVLLIVLLLTFQDVIGQVEEKPSSFAYIQLKELLMKSEIKIPDVDLSQNINLSDTTGIIDRAIVYNTVTDTIYNKTYYYWNQDRWRPIVSDTTHIETLLLWNRKKYQLAYTDAQGDVMIVGVGGLEQLRFVKVDTQNNTLIYRDEKNRDIKVSLSELVDVNTTYDIIVQNGNQLSFSDGTQFITVDLLTAPRAKKNLSKSPKLKPKEIEVLASDFYENALNQEKEEDIEDEEENVVAEVTEEVEVRKTREGREIKAIEDNEDGTFTIVYADGSRFTSLDLTNPKVEVEREIASVVNNGDGTFTANFTDGTSLSSKEITDFYNFGGKDEEASDVELVIDNGDGTYDVILSNGKKLESIDFSRLGQTEEKIEEEDGRGVLSVSNNSDGSFTVLFTDGTEMHSSDMAELQLMMEGNVAGVIDAVEDETEVEAIKIEETAEEDAEETTEDEGELRIKSIVKSDSGTFIILLSNGIFFEASQNFGKADDSGNTVAIENLIDNTDGSYTMVFSDGAELKSVNTIPKVNMQQSADPTIGKEPKDVQEEVNDEDLTVEDSKQEPTSDLGQENTDDKESEREQKSYKIEQEASETQNGSTESVVDSQENRSVPIIDKTQEEVIREQKAEIEALKKREEEKEQEIREMNRRLKRLETLIGD